MCEDLQIHFHKICLLLVCVNHWIPPVCCGSIGVLSNFSVQEWNEFNRVLTFAAEIFLEGDLPTVKLL